MKRTFFSVGKIYLLVVMFIFGLTACDSAPAVNEANHEQTATPSIVPTETLTPTITTTPFPTFTPQPTLNPFVYSSNLISDFYTYDNFMVPFSAEDWGNEENESIANHRTYAFSNQFGILNVDIDPEEYGWEGFPLRIPGEKLTSDINGIAIDIPAPLEEAPRTYAGIYVDLSDGNLRAFYKCGISYDLNGSFFKCETNNPYRELVSIPVPIKELHHIHITWDSVSGSVLFFLNNHLVAYDDLYNHKPIYAESAGIHISRNFQYAGGTRRFSNLQLGTYKQNGYQLPDDLLPKENQPVAIDSSNNKTYLYGDFNNPYYDQIFDYNIWNIQLDQSFINNEYQENLMGFVQKDGMMIFSGNGGLEFSTKESLIGLRSVQFDITANNNLANGSPRFQFYVRNGQRLEVEYLCFVEFRKDEPDSANCVSNDSNGEMISMSESVHLANKQLNTITMRYEDATRELVAELNGEEFDRTQLTYEQKQYIDTIGLQFTALIGNLETEQIGLDNIIFGFR